MRDMLEKIKARYLDRDIISKLEGNELAAVFRADVGWLLGYLGGSVAEPLRYTDVHGQVWVERAGEECIVSDELGGQA